MIKNKEIQDGLQLLKNSEKKVRQHRHSNDLCIPEVTSERRRYILIHAFIYAIIKPHRYHSCKKTSPLAQKQLTTGYLSAIIK